MTNDVIPLVFTEEMKDRVYIKNPVSKKPIKVDGRAFKKLVKIGRIIDKRIDERILYEVKDADQMNKEELDDKLEIAKDVLNHVSYSDDEEFPKYIPVKGRNSYKGKIVKHRKTPSTQEMADHVSKISASVLREEDFNEYDSDLEDQIREAIYDKLNL